MLCGIVNRRHCVIEQISGIHSLSKLKPYTHCTTAPHLELTFLQTPILQEVIKTLGFSSVKQHDLTLVFKCFFKSTGSLFFVVVLSPPPESQIIKKIRGELLR